MRYLSKKNILRISILVFIIFLFSWQSYAATLIIPGKSTPLVPDCGGGPCTACDFFALIQNILNFIWWDLSVPIATLMLIYGGFLMVVPGVGGEKSAGQYIKGKKVLTNTVIGLLIIFVAWLMIDTAIKAVGSLNSNFGPWNQIQCTSASGGGGGGGGGTTSHRACDLKTCVIKLGPGTDECGTNADCSGQPQVFHMGCSGNKCTAVFGAGIDSCSKDADCVH